MNFIGHFILYLPTVPSYKGRGLSVPFGYKNKQIIYKST